MLDLEALSTPPADYDLATHPLPPLTIGPTTEDWQVQRAELLARWKEYLGYGPETVPLTPRTEHSEQVGELTRSLVSYQVEEDCWVRAYLITPDGPGPFPGVVVYHPTTPDTIREPAGLAGPPERHFGLQLAQRGYVTLSPCNYLWDYRGRPGPAPGVTEFSDLVRGGLLARYPHWTGMGKMVWDGLRAVDLLLAQPQVDGTRLGCLGHSLGGKQVLYSMAFDTRLKAGVSSEGGIGLPFTNWDAPWYLGERIHGRPDLEHHQLLTLIAPRALLIVGGGLLPPAADWQAGAADPVQDWSYTEAARPAFALYGVPQHLGLFMHNHGHAVPPEAEQVLYAWFQHFLA